MKKLLIVEDEKRLISILSDYFHKENYQVICAYNGKEGMDQIRKVHPDAIICDVMMPVMDGFMMVKQMRMEGFDIPVLMLTARSELDDKLKGFAYGACDYLTKPFEIEELAARVRVLMGKANEVLKPNKALSYHDLSLDKNTYLLSCKNTSKSIKLSQKEYLLMSYFLRNAGQLLSKAQITEQIWGYDTEVEYNNAEVYISFLRKKIKYLGTQEKIVTVRGGGYIFQ